MSTYYVEFELKHPRWQFVAALVFAVILWLFTA